jgi:hypothetical protein
MSEPPNKNDLPSRQDGSEAPVPAISGEETSQLTKEEQWALFEKELKETDWGHQPC